MIKDSGGLIDWTPTAEQVGPEKTDYRQSRANVEGF
jgi:hypothetical protein